MTASDCLIAEHVQAGVKIGQLVVRSFVRYCEQRPSLLLSSALRPHSGLMHMPREGWISKCVLVCVHVV